jgi:hypothetical protein
LTERTPAVRRGIPFSGGGHLGEFEPIPIDHDSAQTVQFAVFPQLGSTPSAADSCNFVSGYACKRFGAMLGAAIRILIAPWPNR